MGGRADLPALQSQQGLAGRDLDERNNLRKEPSKLRSQRRFIAIAEHRDRVKAKQRKVGDVPEFPKSIPKLRFQKALRAVLGARRFVRGAVLHRGGRALPHRFQCGGRRTRTVERLRPQSGSNLCRCWTCLRTRSAWFICSGGVRHVVRATWHCPLLSNGASGLPISSAPD